MSKQTNRLIYFIFCNHLLHNKRHIVLTLMYIIAHITTVGNSATYYHYYKFIINANM